MVLSRFSNNNTPSDILSHVSINRTGKRLVQKTLGRSENTLLRLNRIKLLLYSGGSNYYCYNKITEFREK